MNQLQDKFIKLYDQEDFSDYGSQSEADAALCSMIAFRAGDDPEMVDEIFRTSALMRDKWERDDYRENTIRYAIDSLEGQFHKAVRKRPPFIVYEEAKGREYVIPNLLAQYVREHLNYVLVRDDGRHALMKYVYEDGYYQYHADDMMKGRIKQFIYQHTNSTVITFYNECMCPWENGKINRHCTAGRIFKVYQAWCKDNNNGFAQNAKEFREQLADYLGTTFSEMTTMQKGNRYYRNHTITTETKALKSKEKSLRNKLAVQLVSVERRSHGSGQYRRKDI